jgi:hypothetical protein
VSQLGDGSFREEVMSYLRLLVPAAVLLVAVSGCGSARMIQTTPDGGIVAIPSNNNSWPFKYRDHADSLMAMKCPNGYDVVREEEVIVGIKTTTTAVTGGVTQAGFKDNASADATTNVTTTTRPQKEYRITFRARQTAPVLVAVVSPPPVLAPVPAVPVSIVSAPTPTGLPPRPEPVVK